MPEEREMYRGREVVVTTRDGEAELLIDDRRVEVSYLETEDVYATKHFPYTNFDSVMDLGKAIVDNWSRIKPELDEEDGR